jgi:hypothetical protein
MEARFHVQLLTETVGDYFDPPALQQIIAANLGQDALRYQLGAFPHYHFDGNEIAKSLAYVEQEHEKLVTLASTDNPGAAQRAAFGRLTHAVHDFYAHSNYVDLWLDANGGLAGSTAEQINGLDATLLNHPQLRTGTFNLWFDLLYYIPHFRSTLRKIYLRPNSHEAMNLDSPTQGPKFQYAMIAAQQRTLHEYHRAADALAAHGGEEALHHFWCV